MIEFACPRCAKPLSLPDTQPGALVKCPHCNEDATAPAPARASLGRRVFKLIVSLVLIALVLLAGVWGGMAWKAGGIQGAPQSPSEFWERLIQQPRQADPEP